MSIPSALINTPVKTKDMLIGALLRVPAQAIHRRIVRELNAAGFDELRLPHIAVLQFPGPDGVRPGTLAERALGEAGFYAVSALGGLVSSASAVASAANLASTGTLSPMVAGVGAIVASLASALVNLPIVSRVARDRRLTRRVAVVIGGLLLVAALGVGAQLLMAEMRR